MATSCAKHPYQPLVGVCAACLRERLAIRMGVVERGGGEAKSASHEALGSSIILCKGLDIDNGNPILRESDKRKLSYYLENIQSNCHANSASHRKAMSSDGIYQRNSFYSSHIYVDKGRDEGGYLQGAKENIASFTKETPSKGRSLSWLSAFFSKREEKQKATSRECSIAPWRECSKECGCEGTIHRCCTEAPPSWEQLPPWGKKPTRSPLKLTSLASSQSARSPLKLPPLVHSAHTTRYPSITMTPLSSQSTSSPLKLPHLRTSPRTPLGHLPLLSYPRSPLKLPSLLSSTPTMTCDVPAQVEVDQRSGQGTPSLHSKRREIWFGVLMRNKWVVRFKRHFAKKKKQDQEADSVRTSSARESDYCRHSQSQYSMQARHGQNHWFMEKNHFQNQRSPAMALNRLSARAGREGERWESASGREYAGWESYSSNSFNSLHVRHRYNSADNAELLRFYLTPVRSTCKLRPH